MIAVHQPSEASVAWLIARRAAWESLRDRMTLLMSAIFALLFPIGLVWFGVRLIVDNPSDLPAVLSFNLLVVGLTPAATAVGIASGQFAGEKERGILTPLLASPASNLSIFAGKVVGAVMPPMLYSAIAVVVYLVTVAVLLGPSRVEMIPAWVGVGMFVLIPLMTTFAAALASLVSSRVRTFSSAQQLTGFALMPTWGVMFAVAYKLVDFGIAGLALLFVALVLIDGTLIFVSASTWRREEVLSQA